MDVGGAAAGDDAFLDRCAGRVEGVFHAVFLVLHLGLGRSADTDHRDAACQLRQSLLKLLAVEVGLRLFDLSLDLRDAVADLVLAALAVDDNGVLLGDLDGLRAAQMLDRDVLQLQADLVRDDRAAGQDRDILQHIFSSVAVARGLHRDHVEGAAELVDDQGGQSLALDVLGDDQELRAHLDDLLEDRQKILDVADLLVHDEDIRLVEAGFHLLHIRAHVSGNIAAVELHALDQIQLGLHGLGLFDGDDAVLADLLHRIRDHLADFLVTGGDRRHAGDLVLALDRLAHLDQRVHSRIGGLLHALLQDDRIGACRQVPHAFMHHGLCQDRRGGGAVAGHVVGLGSHFLDQLRAHVLKAVFQLDLLGDGHAVVGDGRAAVGLLKNNVPALRSQGHADDIRKLVNASLQCFSGFNAVFDLFCHNCLLLYFSLPSRALRSKRKTHQSSTTARMSFWRTTVNFSSPSLTSVPAYLE